MTRLVHPLRTGSIISVVVVMLAGCGFGGRNAEPTPTTISDPAALPSGTTLPTANPPETSTPVPTDTPAPTATPQAAALSVLGALNIRSGPGTDYPVVGVFAEGAESVAVATTEEGGWWKIDCPEGIADTDCWVIADDTVVEVALAIGVPITATPPLPPPTGTPTPVPCVSTKPGGWTTAEIEPGATLSGLAEATGVSIQQLQEANCLEADSIQAGDTIYIPAPTAITATTALTLAVPLDAQVSGTASGATGGAGSTTTSTAGDGGSTGGAAAFTAPAVGAPAGAALPVAAPQPGAGVPVAAAPAAGAPPAGDGATYPSFSVLTGNRPTGVSEVVSAQEPGAGCVSSPNQPLSVFRTGREVGQVFCITADLRPFIGTEVLDNPSVTVTISGPIRGVINEPICNKDIDVGASFRRCKHPGNVLTSRQMLKEWRWCPSARGGQENPNEPAGIYQANLDVGNPDISVPAVEFCVREATVPGVVIETPTVEPAGRVVLSLYGFEPGSHDLYVYTKTGCSGDDSACFHGSISGVNIADTGVHPFWFSAAGLGTGTYFVLPEEDPVFGSGSTAVDPRQFVIEKSPD